MIGPSGVFVIDSKQWSGSVHQGGDGLAWHNHYRLDRTLETVRWEAQQVGRVLGYDRVLSDADVDRLVTTAWASLRPAA